MYSHLRAKRSLVGAVAMVGALMGGGVGGLQTAGAKTITFNNAAGSGVWSTSANNWTTNPYADGDTVTFDTATWAGLVTIPGSVAPATLIIKGSGWPTGIPGGTPVTFSGADIAGSGTISVNQDKTGVFTQDNLSFSGGTFLTSNGATIQFKPPSAGAHGFGTAPITISYDSVNFQFMPTTVGATLTNDWVITSAATQARWYQVTTSNGGSLAGKLTINAGGGLMLSSGTVGIPTTIKGNTILHVCNNGGGTGYITSRIASDASGPYNLTLQSSGNGDHCVQLSGTQAWGVANVERKVSAVGQYGTVFINNETTLFTALAGNGGVFTQTSGTTAFGTRTVVNLNPAINFPLIFTGGGYYGASSINLNLVSGGVLRGAGSLFRTDSYSTAVFNKTLNVNVNPGGVLAMAGGTVNGTVSASGGTVSNGYGAVTIANGASAALLINSGTTTFNMAGTGDVTTGSGTLTRTAGNGGTAIFTGAGLGSTGKVLVNNGAAQNVGGVVPWARAGTATPGTFAVYDGANGFVALAGYGATDDLTVSTNVDLTLANTILSGDPDRSVNAVRLSNGGGLTIQSPRTLTVASGGVLALAGNGGIGGGTLAFGSADGIFQNLGNLSVSSAITGSGGLTKDGAGTLTLSGANSLGTGATAVNAGSLVFGASSALGTGSLTVQPGSTLDMAGFSQAVGGIRDNAGYAVGGLITNSTATLSTLTINNTGSQTFSGLIRGLIALVKNGAGTQTLAGDNGYTGGTTLNANGTLVAGHNNALGFGGLSISGGTIQGANGARTITNALTVTGSFAIGGSSDLTLTAPIVLTGDRTVTVNNTGLTTLSGGVSQDSSTRALIKAGTGTLILPANSAYSGSTTISDGALRADDGTSLPTGSLLVFNGGNAAVLETSGTFSRTIGASAGNVRWAANGGFAAYGAPLAVQLNGGVGTLTWGSANFVPAASSLIFGSVTANNVVDFKNPLDLAGGSRTIRVVDNAATTADYVVLSGGVLNGSGSSILKKAGTGTLRLVGNNTFTGGIEVVDNSASNGTIEFDGAAAMGTGTLWNNYSTTLLLKNISGGSVTLPHEFRSRNNNYNIYLAGNDIFLAGTITGAGGQALLYAATGQTNTINGTITGTPSLRNAAGYTGVFILNPAAGTTGYIPNLAGCTVGIAKDNAFGVPGAGQYTDAIQYTTLFAVGGHRVINTAVRWGHNDNPTQSFIGSYQLTFTADQNTPWFNPNNGNSYFYVTAPLVTMSGVINESGFRYFHKTGTGVLAFTGNNTYSMETMVEAGVFRYSGNGLSPNSFLQIKGGVVETSGSFNRLLGASAKPSSNFNWTSSGGFAAFGGALSVDVNNDGAGLSPLLWGTANFVSSTLILGSTTADNVVTVVDNIGLNGATRTVQVNDNPATTADYAVLAGNLTGIGSSSLTKTGSGTLFLNGANTFAGATTVTAGGIGGTGSLAGNLVLNAGTRFDAVIGQTLTVNNLTIGANCTLNVANGGSGTIIKYSGAKPTEFANLVGLNGRTVSYSVPGEIRILSAGTKIVLR